MKKKSYIIILLGIFVVIGTIIIISGTTKAPETDTSAGISTSGDQNSGTQVVSDEAEEVDFENLDEQLDKEIENIDQDLDYVESLDEDLNLDSIDENLF